MSVIPWQCRPWEAKVMSQFINAWPSLICDCQVLEAQERLCWTRFCQLCEQCFDNLMFSPRGDKKTSYCFIYTFLSNLLLVSEHTDIHISCNYICIYTYILGIYTQYLWNNPAVLQFTQLQGIIFNEAAAWSLHFSLQQTILLCFSFASTC